MGHFSITFCKFVQAGCIVWPTSLEFETFTMCIEKKKLALAAVFHLALCSTLLVTSGYTNYVASYSMYGKNTSSGISCLPC